MKTAKPSASASETLPGRRSQPLRQTRTNPPRSSAIITSSGRTGGRDGRDSVSGAAGHEQPIEIFPAITHFADAITALPKELVRHFTILKEVDAKIYVPQQSLFRLIDTALRMPTPNSTRSPYDGSDIDPASAAADAAAATAASVPIGSGRLPPLPPAPPASAGSATDQAAYDASNLPRRQLFRQVASEIRDMLVALEEKKHVISTANDALNKQLARIDDIWPHLEQEFSDEAKWGSTTHWAYPENRAGLANNNAQAERSRREGAASLSAAAQQIADEAAARSDARKQAVAARRNQKAAAAHLESDADDLQQTKKSGGGSKSRKTLPDSAATVGLGISAVGANGASSKRRKAEKPAVSGAPMERALSGVFGAAASSGSKARTSSPRGSPAPDAKKRKALPAGGSQTKKSRSGTSAASSPVIGALPDVKAGRNLPTPFPSYAPEDIGRSASDGGALSRDFGVDNKSSIGGNTRADEIMTDAPPNENSLFARAVPENTKQPFASSGNVAGHGDDKMINSGIGAGRSGTNVGGISSMGYSSSGGSRGGSMTTNGLSTALATPNAVGAQEIGVGRDIGGSRDVSGREAVTTSALLPALRDSGPHGLRLSSAVQMVALDPSRQRRPSPLSLAATPDSRQANSSPLVTSATAGVDAVSYVNGLRVSAGKSTKDATTTAAAAGTAATPTLTPASAPTPVSAPAPEAALLPPPAPTPVEQTAPAAGPMAVPFTGAPEALKMEPSEINHGSAMGSVSMTRTRSASLLESKERDTKDGISNNGARAATDKVLPSDDPVAKKEPTPTMQAPLAALSSAQAPTVTTKSGRASRPSTPAHLTFAEAPMSGTTPSSSRPARATDGSIAPSAGGSNGSNHGQAASSGGSRKNNSGSGSSSGSSSNGSGSGNGQGGASASTSASSTAAAAAGTSTAFKRSHKKGASSVSAHQTQHGHGQAHSAHGRSQSASHNNHSRGGAGDSETSGGSWQVGGSGSAKSKQAQQQQKQQQEQGRGQEEDDDDPLYCYCNRVSFGEMIACDADDCKREWFHLECVGLRVAPKTSVKWYCDDCKKRLRANERKR